MKKQRLGHLCSGVVYRGQVCETLPPPPRDLAQSKNEMQGGVGGGKGKGQEEGQCTKEEDDAQEKFMVCRREKNDACAKKVMCRTERGMLSRQHRLFDKKRRRNWSGDQTRTRLKKLSKGVL